jgi:formyltetrahydrofolate deformylase
MQVILTAVGPDNRGLADPIVHHVTTAGANIYEIQMYDHDSERLFAMMLRIDWPEEAGPVSELRHAMNIVARPAWRSVRPIGGRHRMLSFAISAMGG